MSDFTIGYWKDDKFDVFAKIRDPQMEHSALAIYAPGTEQDLHKVLSVLQRKGLLLLEDGHYTVTLEGQRYRDALKRSILGMPQVEGNEHE